MHDISKRLTDLNERLGLNCEFRIFIMCLCTNVRIKSYPEGIVSVTVNEDFVTHRPQATFATFLKFPCNNDRVRNGRLSVVLVLM